MVDVDLRRQPDHRHAGRCGDDIDLIAGAGPVDGHLIGRTVVCAEIERHLGHIAASEVVDGDFVGAAQGVDLDVLDVVEVHGDVADVADQAHLAVIGGDVHDLADVGAVEKQRVGAVLTVDDIAAVARVPDERVVTRAELRRIAAAAARDDVIAVAAEQRVIAVAAGDRIVARAAVDREFDEIGEAVPGGDDVVAAISIDDEILGGADVEEKGSGVDAIETHTRAVGRNGERFAAVAAVDLGGVSAVAAFE